MAVRMASGKGTARGGGGNASLDFDAYDDDGEDDDDCDGGGDDDWYSEYYNASLVLFLVSFAFPSGPFWLNSAPRPASSQQPSTRGSEHSSPRYRALSQTVAVSSWV